MADNQLVQSIYDGTMSSLHDFEFPYQIKQKLYQRYGQGQFALDIMRTFDNEFFIKGKELNAHEEGRIINTFTTVEDSTGGATAGAAVYVKVDEADVDSNGDVLPRKDDTVLYKHTDNKTYELLITDKSASSASSSTSVYDTYTLTLEPFDSTLTVGSGGIADGTELSFGATAYAEYTGMPEATSRGMFRRQFKTRISKHKKEMTGVEMARERWEEKLIDGKKNLWNKAYADLEFQLDHQIEMGLFLGQENTNSLTQTDRNGNSKSVLNSKGWWKWMDELSGKLTFGTSDFDIFTLDEVETHLRSEDVTSGAVWMGVGPGLMKKLENAGYEFVQQYSGGTDFTSMVKRAFNGNEERALGTDFSMYQKGGVIFYITVLDSFGKAKGLGNSTYDFNDSGMIVPMNTKIKDPRSGSMYDNIGVGYMNHNGVNRKRVIGMLNGTTGYTGAPIINEYDGMEIMALSHYMPFIMGANQMMQVLPYESY